MRFVVLGAGAVGGVIGGRLAQHGHDVVLIARGPHHDVIREQGLRVESPDGAVTVRAPVVDHPGAVDWRSGDVVLLATKSQDTTAALDALVATGARVPVVCVQNGVANERAALRRFAAVYGVCVMLPTGHLEPGVVLAYSSPTTGILDIGVVPHGTDAAAEDVTAALRSSTFDSEPRPDILRWKYRKLLTNLGNAIEAACGPAARGSDLAHRARAEGEACLAAAGIDSATVEEDRARRGSTLSLRPVGDGPRGGGSSWQSLHRGTGTIEADYLNGEIVLLGRLHGVPTPVNALLQRVANHLAGTGAPPGSLTEADLVAELGQS